MTNSGIAVLLAGICLAALAVATPARADIFISVNKSTQRMTVSVDGRVRYVWPVSTGRPGYDTPNGTFRPFRMDLHHKSEEYDNAPMPYSIFFTGSGDAVHGTYERGLGSARSHGCVRISVGNAATLWRLVTKETMWSTTVEITGSVRGRGSPMVASSDPTPPAGSWQNSRRSRNRQALFPFFLSRR